ncbi:uncharacterized protein LOC108101257 [Drosophila ficusphila]|uniref:uncharacterized protein LOC108101257 n=1 Tax=Drosophila ficusphila TaxID=30025 RepID=UPI001C894E02|nr:uncharacterized protein LOC108101257 [Drosophila ficusphila]
MGLATGLFLIVSVLLVSSYEAAVVRGVFKDPAHPGKCVVDGLILEKGQGARHPKRCERVVCEDNSNAQIQSCGSVGLLPGQKFGEYISPNGDYPACCERKIINK